MSIALHTQEQLSIIAGGLKARKLTNITPGQVRPVKSDITSAQLYMLVKSMVYNDEVSPFTANAIIEELEELAIEEIKSDDFVYTNFNNYIKVGGNKEEYINHMAKKDHEKNGIYPW